MIIDTHAHVVPGTMLAALRSEQRLFPSVRLHDGEAPRMDFGQGPGRPIQPRLHDLAQRRAWLASARVDRQLVGGWTDVYGYDLPPEEGADWARFYNEHMAKDAAALTALSALATVPLQDGALAARVLAEALDQGFKGAMIATMPKGNAGGNLDDADLDPFWELASARGATIFVHPHYICGDERLAGYDLVNAVGRLADTTIAVGRLLFSGHLTRFPGMTLVLSHAGGALPYALGRLKRNRAIHPEYADPAEGFRRLYFDTVLFEPLALRFLCDVAGADKVVLGSDFPFGIGDPDPCGVVGATALTEAERGAILGGNAARIFHIDCGCGAALAGR